MRNRDGEPTGAIYGMVAMLRRLRADAKLNRGATHGAVVFDPPGKTFRDDIYPEYKANRAEMPEDLRRQIPIIHELVRALGWPLVMVSGLEADDVIGTLAARASAHGIHTLVSTGDKDLAQLVDERVTLFNTMPRDTGAIEWLDPTAVEEKFGVPPSLIVDWLSLVGDSVDNVPGVDKVGPKTAVKWLQKYGSLDEIIAHADEIPGKVGENLRAALEWLPTARELVTVKRDCELPPEIADLDGALSFSEESLAELRELFERCSFRTWLRDVEDRLAAGGKAGAAPDSAGVGPATAYETILAMEDLDRWIERIRGAGLVAFDTETTSLDPMLARIVGLSLSVEPGHACYVPMAHDYAGAPAQLPVDEVLGRMRDWLEDPGAKKVGQNLKYDMHVLENHGIRLAGVEHDTLLQSYVLEAHRSHDMDALAARHLDRRTITYTEVAGKGAKQIPFSQVDLERATAYASEDADVTLQLHLRLYPDVEADPSLLRIYRDIEMPTLRVLQRMERNGVLVDADALAAQSDALGRQMLELERRAHEAAGQVFNLNSPKQLGEILFTRLELPVLKKTASGTPSTDEEVLGKLAEDYPLPRLVLEYRGVAKLKSTYTDKLPRMIDPRTGRVHTNYSQATAVTGRLASTEPNLQNIPIRTADGRRIREAFIAPPGSLIMSCDYSQIELRIMAHISGDASLRQAFERGLDIHRATAGEIFGIAPEEVGPDQRRLAKVINFGLMYGMSAYGLASNLGIERDAARNYIDRYFSRYPGVAAYMEETRRLAKAQGYVETVFGRRLWLAEINSPNGPRRQAAERAAINAPMQGTAADLIKMAMIAVQDWLTQTGAGARLIMQVHDELVLEVPQDEVETLRAKVPELMTGVASLSVPLLVETGVGPNWDKAH